MGDALNRRTITAYACEIEVMQVRETSLEPTSPEFLKSNFITGLLIVIGGIP